MKYLSFLALALFFVSCNMEVTYQTVIIDEKFQMDIPDYMSEMTDLSDVASLQYGHESKESYVAVINEDKEELINWFGDEDGLWDTSLSPLENYSAIQSEGMEMTMDITDQTDIVEKKINGMPAKIYEYTGYASDIMYEIYYYVVYIEGGRDMYMISAWCLADDKSDFRDIYVKMIDSFKEL